MVSRSLQLIRGGTLQDDYRFSSIDLLVCALGYETRAPFIASKVTKQTSATRKVAFSFGTPGVLSFDENFLKFSELGFSVQPFERSEAAFIDQVVTHIGSSRRPDSKILDVVVDISCMSRKMIALIIEAIATCDLDVEFRVQFVYAAAAFHVRHQDGAPTIVSEPVTSFFAGWTDNPNLAASMIMGLGFEYSRALGTIEDLQPSHLSLFIPIGEDERFDDKVRELNATVLSEVNPVSITSYRVLDPMEQVSLLYSALRGYSSDSRPIIVPLGPKVFALSSMLAALSFRETTCVWRVSPDDTAPPIDQVESGTIVFLEVAL